jgi:RNA polymerase sigma-70 factor (ECF subfamily)
MDERELLELLAVLRAADQARERLLELVRTYLHALAVRAPAFDPAAGPSDIVHDVAIVVLRSLSSFRGGSRGEFLAWLRDIFSGRTANAQRDATRQCRDQRRNEHLDDVDPLSDLEDTPSALAQQGEEAERLWQEVDRLPHKLRMVFLLRQKHGLKSREIADVLADETESTIRALFKQAMSLLKQRVGEAQ